MAHRKSEFNLNSAAKRINYPQYVRISDGFVTKTKQEYLNLSLMPLPIFLSASSEVPSHWDQSLHRDLKIHQFVQFLVFYYY